MDRFRTAILHGGIGILTATAVTLAIPTPGIGETTTYETSSSQAQNSTNRQTPRASTDAITAVKAKAKAASPSRPKRAYNPLAGKSRLEAKKIVARTGYEAAVGRVSKEKYQRLSNAFAKKYPANARPTQALARDSAAGRAGRSSARGAHTGANSVRVEHVGQERDWWCGPATAYMIISQLKRDGKIKWTQSQSGEKLTQSALAGDSFLAANGGGGTYRDDLKNTLNKWTGKKLFNVRSSPNTYDFASSLIMSIDSGQAMAVATLEPAGERHYNGHPNGSTIDHWIVASGYDKKGSLTHFADPATTIWSSTDRYFSYNTQEFVQRYVEPSKAIVW